MTTVSYCGETDEDDYPCGFGVCIYHDDKNTKYCGEWEDGVKNGFGILETNDYRFQGQFENGKRGRVWVLCICTDL